MKNVIVRLDNIKKNFGDKKIIKGITLDIFEGEFITFLGPSDIKNDKRIRKCYLRKSLYRR